MRREILSLKRGWGIDGLLTGRLGGGKMDERLVVRWGEMEIIHSQLLSPVEGLVYL